MSTTGEIRFMVGPNHRCIFGLSDWVGTFDPPWVQGENGLYSPIPGVEHKHIVRNIVTGEVISDDEWRRRLEAGTLNAAS